MNDDNSKFTDPQWVAETETALSALRGSAEALNNLPESDSEEYDRLAGLTKQLAEATLDAADPYIDQINSLLPQINAKVGSLSD